MNQDKLVVTSDANGNATEYAGPVTGAIATIRYKKDATAPYTDGIDLTVTLERTGETVLAVTNMNAAATYHPAAQYNLNSSAAAMTYDGTYPVPAPIIAVNDRLKFVVGSAGDSKVGTFYITYA